MSYTLSVMEWNIAEGRYQTDVDNGRIGEIIDQIAAQNPHIVLLNELLNYNRPFGGGGHYLNQARYIAEQAGYPYCAWYNVAILQLYAFKCVAILSKFPIQGTAEHSWPRTPVSASSFGALEATISAYGIAHRVFSTRFSPIHYPDPGWEVEQLDNVAGLDRATTLLRERPADQVIVFGGDFNVNPDPGPHAVDAFNRFVRDSGLTHAAGRSVDQIFFRGPYQAGQELEGPAHESDHSWLMVELSNPEPDACVDLRGTVATMTASIATLRDRLGQVGVDWDPHTDAHDAATAMATLRDQMYERAALIRQGHADGCGGLPAVTPQPLPHLGRVAGHLLEFYKEPDNDQWAVYDHTPETGGTLIDGRPTLWVSPGDVVHLYARGFGRLLEFYKEPIGSWRAFDHTASTAALVTGDPELYVSGGDTVHLYVRGLTGHLLEFYKEPAGRWQVYDHTPETGGALINGKPTLWESTGGVVHLYCRSTVGHLLEFYKEPAGPWRVYDHTREVGSTGLIIGDPTLWVSPGDVVHLYCRNLVGHLVEFYKEPAGHWQVFDHTPDITWRNVAGDPTLRITGGTVVHLYVRSIYSRLLEFYKAMGSSWEVYDRSSGDDGVTIVTIAGDPSWWESGGELHMYARSPYAHLEEITVRGRDWTAVDRTWETLATISSDPTLWVGPLDVVHLYAAGGN